MKEYLTILFIALSCFGILLFVKEKQNTIKECQIKCSPNSSTVHMNKCICDLTKVIK